MQAGRQAGRQAVGGWGEGECAVHVVCGKQVGS